MDERCDCEFQGGDDILDVILAGVKRIVRFFSSEKEMVETREPVSLGSDVEDAAITALEPESPEAENLIENNSTTPVTMDEGDPVDLSRWTVTEHIEPPFEKVGRLYVEGDDLVIRSDLDNRGFCVLLVDVDAILDGEVKSIRLLGSSEEVGTVKVSVSGKGMNFTISPFFYTTPLQSVMRMLTGEVRKAPLFVGREQVEGGFS